MNVEKKNSVVVFGGSFNPPLNSHLLMAEEVLNQFEEVEKVIFVPVNSKYHKDGLIENKHRYNMLKLAIDKNKEFMVSDIDFYGERSLYTIEVLEKIQNQFKDKKIYFLTGSDNLKLIYSWKCAEELLSKYKILVMTRDKDNIQEIIYNDKLLNKYSENIKEMNSEAKIDISSTFIRSQIKKEKRIKYMLPDEICEYIFSNNLYK